MDNQIIAEPSDKCIFNTYEDPEQWNNAYDNNFTKKEKTIEEDDLDIERIYFNESHKNNFSRTRDIQNIVNQILVSKIWDTTWINPNIFKDKYVTMLYEIGFSYGYEMITDRTDILLPQLIHHLFVPDTLGVFIEQYNFLLNKELLK